MRGLPRPILVAVAIALAAPAAGASAAWTHSGSGAQTAKAISMPAGNTPTASVSNRSVTVSWTGSTLPGGSAITTYLVKRYDTNGNAQTIGSSRSGTISALTCTETSVPGGAWKYTISPTLSNWTGAESAQSTAATVASPSLTFSSSTTVTSLPTTLNGSIAAFVGGQTVTFRLDDASTGTVLSGTLSPTPIPSGGGSSITVTIPAGTTNGAHTVYAVGSSGDVASAAITVAVPYTTTTTAWDLRDASSGIESNQSAASAFVDTRTFATGVWPTAFNTNNYLEFDQNAPLPSGFTVTGGTFTFNFAAGASGDTACFWFEVRRASTGAVVGTHGGSASPVGCVTGTTLQSFSTAISELNTTDLANDNRIRVYARESAGKSITVEQGVVTGSTPMASFTLYPTSYTDASTGTPATTTWTLTGSGGSTFTTGSNWASAFSSTRYLKVTFPSYIPT